MYRFRLELDGYRVELATDGLAGLEMARTSAPDLLLLDIRLPKLTGVQVLEALRADAATQDLHVVVLSNLNDEDLVRRTSELGVLDHLVKSQTSPSALAGMLPGWLAG